MWLKPKIINAFQTQVKEADMTDFRGVDNRRSKRKQYQEWVEFGPLCLSEGLLETHFQSAAIDLNDQGLGVLTATPIEVGIPMLVRLRTTNMKGAIERFGHVVSSRPKGNWYLCGIEFAELPKELGDLTFAQAMAKAA